MNTVIKMYNKYDWKVNKKSFEDERNKIERKKLKEQHILVYFDDDLDEYVYYIATIMGDRLGGTCYSWDDLSTLIHDNI